MKPKLLDLFSCAGGAGVGYERAGFDVYAVDIEPQPHNPHPFYQGDALEVLRILLAGDSIMFSNDETLSLANVDAIHASPPCQAYTTMSNRKRGDWPDLIVPTRGLIGYTHKPYVIENVVGARSEMRHAVALHGGMFGLGVDRARLFETSFVLMFPPIASRIRNPLGVYGKLDGRRLWTRSDGSMQRAAKGISEASEAMGIDWMTADEIREAIPPAYTEFIGGQLLGALELTHANP